MAAVTEINDDQFLEEILRSNESKFGDLLRRSKDYKFQVLLSRLQLDPRTGRRSLVRSGYRVDHEYFYPASSIKLCGVVAALMTLEQYRRELGADITVTSPLFFYPLFPGEKGSGSDHTNLDGQTIMLAHEIRKLFLVSDNVAYNRLYAFTGQRALNEAMWDLGLQSARLYHRLSVPRTPEENRMTERISVTCDTGSFSFPARTNPEALPPVPSDLPGLKIGSAYIDDSGTKVEGPMDFSEKNRLSLLDLQNLLIKTVRPDIDINLGMPGIQLDESLRALVLEAMVQYPGQSSNPIYSPSAYPDDWCKFFLPGLLRVQRKGALRIFNKIGQAYGFTVDNSYIRNVETGSEFFLTAVMYTNANGVLNDEEYEYGLAFDTFSTLAEVVARAVWKPPLKSVEWPILPSDDTPRLLADGSDQSALQGVLEARAIKQEEQNLAADEIAEFVEKS